MCEIKEEIISEIKKLEIPCPDCECMYSDDQYTCTTCWCEGGQGTINVVEWIKDNPEVIDG